MSRRKKFDFTKLADTRKRQGLNQSEFWNQYGITQSGGSRYEANRSIPRPARILIWLHQTGKITDADLRDALIEASAADYADHA